jgi:hypothetical protein
VKVAAGPTLQRLSKVQRCNAWEYAADALTTKLEWCGLELCASGPSGLVKYIKGGHGVTLESQHQTQLFAEPL